jgi:D-alanyl-D-alanine carboxypeptidase/D-alanyl-D-alanine-endopeptidase (penicillin-binding protein 4)
MNNMAWMNKFIISLFYLFASVSLLAQSLPAAIEDIPGSASYSLLVRDLESGEDLVSIEPEKTLISASLMKVVTTATALEVLGPDFQFSTSFWIDGNIRNGVLNGNLIIEGGGDPSLGSRYFDGYSPEIILSQIDGLLERKGIKRISGQILLDQSWISGARFPSRRLWEDMGNYYGAPPAAITWRDNTFQLVLKSSLQTGEKCEVVKVEPPLSGISFISNVLAANHQKDSAYIYGVPGMKKWEVRGSIPAGRSEFTIKGALPYPGITFAEEIASKCLDQSAIRISVVENPEWKDNAEFLGVLKSPELSVIVKEINQRSLNLGADHLLLAIGKNSEFSYLNDWDKGLDVIRKFWESKIDQDYYINIKDGSGVAPLNTLSSLFLVEVLDYMYHESTNSEAFKNSLARSGRSGTFKYTWDKGPLEGRVLGKSGSMQDVMCYSGYVLLDEKEPLAFSVMVNHFELDGKEMRQIIEKLLHQAVSDKL